ncbi:MAG: DNA adenine methylase, partial [Nitrospinota bacterium]
MLPQLEPSFPTRFHAYHEPFLGGGAVFFHLRPRRAFLSDSNAELIGCYRTVRDRVEELIRALSRHRYEREHFYEVRSQAPESLDEVERAARFIFLNKSCYNGLYRVNRRGLFNVPFGRYAKPTLCDARGLRTASRALRGVTLFAEDFEGCLPRVRPGDFVYFDPPYLPLSPTSQFTSYTEGGFSLAEQKRLAGLFRALDARGALLLLSNSDSQRVRELYAGYRLEVVKAPRAINCAP